MGASGAPCGKVWGRFWERLEALAASWVVFWVHFFMLVFGVVFKSAFGSIWDGFCLDFIKLGKDFGRFWQAKIEPKIDFWEGAFQYFFRMRFNIDFTWFLGGSKPHK